MAGERGVEQLENWLPDDTSSDDYTELSEGQTLMNGLIADLMDVGLYIPTRIVGSNQYYLPGIKIDNLLKNYQENLADQGQRRMLASNVIEGEISNGKTNLSTELENDTKNIYDFTVGEKLMQDVAPPSAIKIEKLPK